MLESLHAGSVISKRTATSLMDISVLKYNSAASIFFEQYKLYFVSFDVNLMVQWPAIVLHQLRTRFLSVSPNRLQRILYSPSPFRYACTTFNLSSNMNFAIKISQKVRFSGLTFWGLY